jgi:aspartyl-tRNA(Asn)/glutamyl-tRNA(Gln) amidotransferase subunit C
MSTSEKPIITAEDIRKVAHLARLKVDEEAINKHVDSLSHILEMIAHINDLDTKDITAMSSSLDTDLALRDDAVTAPDQHNLLQKLGAQTESGFYLVPQVIE